MLNATVADEREYSDQLRELRRQVATRRGKTDHC
jgi:hypothetical protein